MPEIPLTIRCECGETHAAVLGQHVRCVCGRVYDTTKLDQTRLGGVRGSQARMRLYMTLGVLLIVGGALVTYILWGPRGVAVAIPVAGLIWFRFLGRWLRPRVFHGAGELPSWRLNASKDD